MGTFLSSEINIEVMRNVWSSPEPYTHRHPAISEMRGCSGDTEFRKI